MRGFDLHLWKEEEGIGFVPGLWELGIPISAISRYLASGKCENAVIYRRWAAAKDALCACRHLLKYSSVAVGG